MHVEAVEADAKSENKNMTIDIPSYKINLTGSPNSCIIKIGKNKFRSLVDTGAEVYLMHRRIYNSLKVINLSSVSGDALKIYGCTNLTFSIGGTEM